MPGQGKGFTFSGRNTKRRLSFSMWNVNGLHDRILGNKFENADFISHLNNFDFLVLTETWTHRTVIVPSFVCFNSIDNNKSNTSGRVG